MTKDSQHKRLLVVVWCLRIIVGFVFIYSGFVKAIDLWGFIYKLEEYFGICDLTLPRSVLWTIAMLTSGLEFISGLLLLMGCYKRSVPIFLSAMMAVMLPVTLYLFIADPIEDCGCFGDALLLSNGLTFFKNVILTAMIVVLVRWNHRVRQSVFHPDIQWIVVVCSMVYIVVLGLLCYNIQPVIDFRPYPEGTSLINHDNSSEENIRFVYTDGEEEREFMIDDLPDDSVWTFVGRVGDEDNEAGMIGIYDGDEDVTDLVLDDDRRQFLLVIPDMQRADISNSYFINVLSRFAADCDIDFIGLLATNENGIEKWKDMSLAEYPCYTVEDTSLKELVRGNVSLVYVDKGTILWKRTVSTFETNDLADLKNNYGCDFPNHMTVNLKSYLIKLTSVFVILLLSLWIIQILVTYIIRKKQSEKKTNENANK